MLLKEVILQAMSSLVTNRFRAMMTMFGIAWGIVTVVLLMAYGNGFRTALLNGFRNAFSDGTGVVYNGQTSLQAGGERAGRRIWLKEADAEAIRQLGLVKRVSPEYPRVAARRIPEPADDGRRARRRARVRLDATRGSGGGAFHQ